MPSSRESLQPADIDRGLRARSVILASPYVTECLTSQEQDMGDLHLSRAALSNTVAISSRRICSSCARFASSSGPLGDPPVGWAVFTFWSPSISLVSRLSADSRWWTIAGSKRGTETSAQLWISKLIHISAPPSPYAFQGKRFRLQL